MNLNEFANQVIGKPFVDRGRDFSGFDCWGLVVLAYKECFNIYLPDGLEYSCFEPNKAKEALIEGASTWTKIELGEEKPGDVICIRPCHVGLIINYDKMLHTRETVHTCIERYNSPIWKSLIFGIYRHEQLTN